MVVKIVYALKERSEHSLEEFQTYWRDTHGPLVTSFQNALQMIKYVQVHRAPGEVDTGLRASREALVSKDPVFNIVDHYWFKGSQNDIIERFQSVEGQSAWKAILKSEKKFIDFGNSTLIFVQPRIIIPPREPYLRALPGNSIYLCNAFAEFDPESYDYYYDVHGPMCARLADAFFAKKYIQDHPRDVQYVERMRRDRGMEVESKYNFCTNEWFETRGTANDETFQQAMKEISADEEGGLIKPHSLNALMGNEFCFIDVDHLWYS